MRRDAHDVHVLTYRYWCPSTNDAYVLEIDPREYGLPASDDDQEWLDRVSDTHGHRFHLWEVDIELHHRRFPYS